MSKFLPKAPMDTLCAVRAGAAHEGYVAMHSSSSVLLAGGLCLALGALLDRGPAPAAPPAPSNATAPLTLRKDVREVTISFTVTDEDGRPVGDLRADQVAIYADGSPVRAMHAFYRERDLPLNLAVLVDTSDSVTPTFLAELKATDQFAARLVRPAIDHLSWTGFAAGVETYPSTSGPALRPAAFGRTAIGQTALYDAIYSVANREPGKLSQATLSRKALILLSDGEDNWSRHSIDDAIQAAQAAGFTIYCLTAHDPRSERSGDAVLRKLAFTTGGRAYILASYDHVDGVLEQIEAELRLQYLLAFAPPSTACGAHSVKIVSTDRALQTQSRNAYYVDGC
jgi:Ca-activated chloride channel homolog